jgi:GH15 family glucan-1,4-alpha-glucosidase
MCWVTVDRAEKISRQYQGQERPDLCALRDEIAADVLEHGWKPELESFGAAYDGSDLDAAALSIGLAGLLAPDDPRFASTVRAIENELRDGPTVYRYHSEDGLPGPEGGFHFCAQWLIEAYLLVGRRSDAEELFESVTKLAGPTGLLSEQYDPQARRSLGNHPQAYSHLGLIRNALLLSQE